MLDALGKTQDTQESNPGIPKTYSIIYRSGQIIKNGSMFWSQLVFKKRQGCYSGCFNIPQLRDHLVCEVSQFWLMFLFLFWWFTVLTWGMEKSEWHLLRIHKKKRNNSQPTGCLISIYSHRIPVNTPKNSLRSKPTQTSHRLLRKTLSTLSLCQVH